MTTAPREFRIRGEAGYTAEIYILGAWRYLDFRGHVTRDKVIMTKRLATKVVDERREAVA